jgi:starvation-inducible DNA-binding protein
MLADELKKLLGTTFVLYTKVHGFHFNVEGPDFPQYHQLLGDIYEDIYSSIDKIGEYIRTLDSYTPGSLARMLELSVIQEQPKIPRAELMFAELIENNTDYICLLNECFKCADEENQQGIADFIAGRLDAMNKHQWMMKAIMKRQRA